MPNNPAIHTLIHQANLAREQGSTTIPADVTDPLYQLFRDGVLVGLSATTSHGTRPGERKARLLLEVFRDREADVLRFASDLNVPPTSNQAERDLRPAKVQQNISGRLTSEKRTQDRYTIRGYLSTAAKRPQHDDRPAPGHHRPTLDAAAPRPRLIKAAPPTNTDEHQPGSVITPCHQHLRLRTPAECLHLQARVTEVGQPAGKPRAPRAPRVRDPQPDRDTAPAPAQ